MYKAKIKAGGQPRGRDVGLNGRDANQAANQRVEGMKEAFNQWLKEFVGKDTTSLYTKRIRQLEQENVRLNKMIMELKQNKATFNLIAPEKEGDEKNQDYSERRGN